MATAGGVYDSLGMTGRSGIGLLSMQMFAHM